MGLRSGDFWRLQEEGGCGFPARNSSSHQPHRASGQQNPPSPSRETSVWALRARVSCHSGAGAWEDTHQHAHTAPQARLPLPRSTPSFPGAVTDEDSPMKIGAGHTGERQGVHLGALCTFKVDTRLECIPVAVRDTYMKTQGRPWVLSARGRCSPPRRGRVGRRSDPKVTARSQGGTALSLGGDGTLVTARMGHAGNRCARTASTRPSTSSPSTKHCPRPPHAWMQHVLRASQQKPTSASPDPPHTGSHLRTHMLSHASSPAQTRTPPSLPASPRTTDTHVQRVHWARVGNTASIPGRGWDTTSFSGHKVVGIRDSPG